MKLFRVVVLSICLSICLFICLSCSLWRKRNQRTGQLCPQGNAPDLLKGDRSSGGNLSLSPSKTWTSRPAVQTNKQTNSKLNNPKQRIKKTTLANTPSLPKHSSPNHYIVETSRSSSAFILPCLPRTMDQSPIVGALIPLEIRGLANTSDLDLDRHSALILRILDLFVFSFIYFVAYILFSLRILHLCLDCCLLLLLLNLQLVLHHIHQC